MKLFLIVACLLSASLAVPTYEPISIHYHENFGIQQAARIKAIEEAQDFNGERIIGGTPAELGEHPYVGGLIITLTSGDTSICASSLISNVRAVTAAHCWWDGSSQAAEFEVVLGSLTLFSGGTRFTTSDVTIHESFNPDTRNYDVAIIRFPWVTFTNNIRSIPLALGYDTYEQVWADAAGYGITSNSGSIGVNQVLNVANVEVIENRICRLSFGSSIVLESTLCVNTLYGRGMCRGDTGGPLTYNGALIGVASFVAQVACTRYYPAGYARVTYFESWLRVRL